MEGVGLGNVVRMNVSSTESLMKEIWKTKHNIKAVQKNKSNSTMAVVVCATEFVRVVVVLCVCPSQTIRRGKHCDISRPSYSNQKIKVPLFSQLPPFGCRRHQP